MAYCDIKSNKYGFNCSNSAAFVVAYFQDGSGSKRTCAQHLAKAVQEVAVAANLFGSETLRVLPIDAMRDRISSARLR